MELKKNLEKTWNLKKYSWKKPGIFLNNPGKNLENNLKKPGILEKTPGKTWNQPGIFLSKASRHPVRVSQNILY